jgi:hypothetical protein
MEYLMDNAVAFTYDLIDVESGDLGMICDPSTMDVSARSLSLAVPRVPGIWPRSRSFRPPVESQSVLTIADLVLWNQVEQAHLRRKVVASMGS